MDKQLNDIKQKLAWIIVSHDFDETNDALINELESYINDNYVSKDKLQELYKTGLEFEAKMGMAKKGNEYSAQFLDNILKAIDTLVSVPTPESLVYDL